MLGKRISKQSLGRKTGQEGPSYDPYGFTEYYFSNDYDLFVVHKGLGSWISINGVHIESSDFSLENSIIGLSWTQEVDFKEMLLEVVFEDYTGLEFKKLEKYYNRIHRPIRCCASRKLDWTNGYPGEHFLQCINCGHVHDVVFRISEVI